MFKIKYHAGKDMTYKEAARLAKEEAETIRQEGSRQGKWMTEVKQDVHQDEGHVSPADS
jgi:hypothetical protein